MVLCIHLPGEGEVAAPEGEVDDVDRQRLVGVVDHKLIILQLSSWSWSRVANCKILPSTKQMFIVHGIKGCVKFTFYPYLS